MRHRKDHRKLSRTASHRRAVLRNLVTALFQYERIETTVAKAKEARRLAERLITFGKQGDLPARRHVARFVTRPAVAAKLFDTYGVHFDPKLRDEVVARVDKLNLPSYSGFVQPKLEAVTAADGKITDVKISYPLDLTTQMLEYDGVKR